VFEEQKETLKKERGEHMTVVEKLQKAEQELKRLSREFDALDKRCEELQFHNHTLVDDKKQLQQTLDQMKAGGAKVDAGGGLERELRELQDSLHQKVMEHSEELRNKDKEMQQLRMLLEDTEYKYVISHSKLSEIEKEHEQHVTDLKDKVGSSSCSS
jgi:predicted RNase H-like nuclease (RuvC/YqgF family)